MDWCPINFPSRVPNGRHCVRSGWQALALGTMGTGTLVHSFGSMYLSPDDYLQWLVMAAGKLHAE